MNRVAGLLSLSGIAIAGVIGLCAPATAQQPPAPATQDRTTERPSDGVSNEAEASRQRTEAREREWDRKMRASTKSICKGC